ncbi:MAG: cytidylate kinase-like family protein [Anaerolineae bacterium]
MAVITISRYTGSGGQAIGEKVAERLGAEYLDTQIVQEVARRLGISPQSARAHDEAADSFVDRLTRIMWLSNTSLVPMDMGQVPVDYESPAQQELAVTQQMVREVAAQGNAVIFGHGSQFILAKAPGVLHVQCIAPLAYRVQRVMRNRNVSQPEAEKWVKHEDERRAGYLRQFYHVDWRDPTPFHLVLNTAMWSEDQCVELIIRASEMLSKSDGTSAKS